MPKSETIPGEALMIGLGHAVESRLLSPGDSMRAQSLIRWWAQQTQLWTPQWDLAAALLSKSIHSPVTEFPPNRIETRAGVCERVPPYPYTRGGPWWKDTRPERQAQRGYKSGIMRRERTRERDAKIKRWHETGKHTVIEMARFFEISRQAIYKILRRVIAVRPPLVEKKEDNRTNMKVQNSPMREPPHADAVDPLDVSGRSPRLFQGLMRWCGLRLVKDLPDEAVYREAERLNRMEDRPMKPARVAGIARKVCRYRERWGR